MAESIFLRVSRVLNASAEEAVDALERVSGPGVMREAIRQVERAMDDVRHEHRSAQQRGAQARKLEAAIGERIVDLEEKARFALGKGREDLAEAALSSQVDLESRIAELRKAQSDADAQAAKLESCLKDLGDRKARMERELSQFEAARRDADRDSCSDRIERRVERAETAFGRVKEGKPDLFSVGDDLEGSEPLAEIEAIRRSAAVSERLAALRASAAKATARKGGGRRA